MPGSVGRRGLLLTADLFFSSKVTGTAAALGLTVELASTPEDAVSRLSGGDYALVIVDLSTPGLSVGNIVQALPSEPRPRVIAFAPHIETGWLEAARQSGCDLVLPRSRFSAELPRLLREALAG